MAASGAVDPYLDAESHIVYQIDPINGETGVEETKGTGEEDHSNVDKLAAFDVGDDAHDRVLELTTPPGHPRPP